MLDIKKQRFIDWKADRTNDIKVAAYTKAKADAQRETRKIKNDWWIKKSCEMHKLAVTKDSRGFYSAMKMIYGSRYQQKTVIKSRNGISLRDRQDIRSRWEEYYKNLLNSESEINRSTLETLPKGSLNASLDEPPKKKRKFVER